MAKDELRQLRRKWVNLKVVYKLEHLIDNFAKMRYVSNELDKYNGYNLDTEKLYQLVKYGLENAKIAELKMNKLKKEIEQFIRRM